MKCVVLNGPFFRVDLPVTLIPSLVSIPFTTVEQEPGEMRGQREPAAAEAQDSARAGRQRAPLLPQNQPLLPLLRPV